MAQDIFIKLLNMSYQGGIIICFILLARYILHLIKAPKKYAYYLWLIAFVRLICPFSFESVLSVLPQETEPIRSTIIYDQVPEIHTGSATINQVVNSVLPKADVVTSINPMQVIMAIAQVIWLVGIGIFLIYCIVSFIRLKIKLIGCTRYGTLPYSRSGVDKQSLEKSSNCIYLSDYIATPFVLGVIKPHIYLPSTIGEKEMSYILMHEQAHVKRKDHVIKLIVFGITIIHWFNPVVWIAYMLINQDMEMACDEYVMKNYNGDIRKEYATSLLNLSIGRRRLLGVPLAFGEGNVKGRIKNVTRYKKPLISVAICAVIGCVILGVALLTSPPSTSEVSPITEDNESPTQVEDILESDMEEIVVSIPTIDLEGNLGADGAMLDYADGNIIVFHDYFGLFVYDLNIQKFVRAVDLEAIGCNYTQGDNYCEVSVSADGTSVYLHPISEKDMYVFHVPTGKLYKTTYDLTGITLFDGLVDNDLAGSGNGVYSMQKVIFKTNELTYYGYLYAGEEAAIRDLAYVEDDMIFSLFESLGDESIVPEGISMSVQMDSVTKKGAVITLLNKSDKDYQYGDQYYLQKHEDGRWYDVPYVIENYGFNDIAYGLEKNNKSEFKVDWNWLYGELEPGEYRIVKDIMDFRDTGDYDVYTLTAEFIIE
ncbi:MAG: hypothetical protein KIC94_15260 [Clostridiales bacterium]|nr:hypothetical protein [Clostridiales bacterium]